MMWSPRALKFSSWSPGALDFQGRSPGALNPFGTLILALVQTQVLAAHQNASKELEKWESEFAVNNGFPPMYEDYKTEAAIQSANKKRKLSRQLLKHWKITVHLQ